MILPIYTYGQPILRQKTDPVESDSEEVQKLIDDMVETMHGASGVGLAAPPVGRSERLFVVDLSVLAEDDEAEEEGEAAEEGESVSGAVSAIGPLVFINPELEFVDGDTLDFEEGCLSIPEIREEVRRPVAVIVRFLDRNFEPNEMKVEGLLARVIQHEFDHLEGILFVDRLSPLKKRLLRRRLREMARGAVSADYPLLTAS
jgi:peptide deformylase